MKLKNVLLVLPTVVLLSSCCFDDSWFEDDCDRPYYRNRCGERYNRCSERYNSCDDDCDYRPNRRWRRNSCCDD